MNNEFKLHPPVFLPSSLFNDIAHNWASHKKQLGEMIASKFRTHKQYLRKNKLGKFAKH